MIDPRREREFRKKLESWGNAYGGMCRVFKIFEIFYEKVGERFKKKGKMRALIERNKEIIRKIKGDFRDWGDDRSYAFEEEFGENLGKFIRICGIKASKIMKKYPQIRLDKFETVKNLERYLFDDCKAEYNEMRFAFEILDRFYKKHDMEFKRRTRMHGLIKRNMHHIDEIERRFKRNELFFVFPRRRKFLRGYKSFKRMSKRRRDMLIKQGFESELFKFPWKEDVI